LTFKKYYYIISIHPKRRWTVIINIRTINLKKSIVITTNWYNPKKQEYINQKEYNKLAQQAKRKKKTTTEYMEELGYKKDK